jgi:SRSO17 transposase
MDHQSLNHLLTDSPWDHVDVFDQLSSSAGALMNRQEAIGFLIDEVGFRKKGKHSACVGRQYLGSIGKHDNGQVAVVGGLSQGVHYCPVVAELFMPKSWEEDPERRKKAGVPDHVVHRTKPQMALEIILKQREKGTRFDFVGFDALYGSSMAMIDSLEDNGVPFIGDIKENMHVFRENPSFGFPIPEVGKKGRKRKFPKTDSTSISVRDYTANLKEGDWVQLSFRKGTKKPIKALFHKREVWVCTDEKKGKAVHLILLVRKDPDGKTKYSLTNMRGFDLLALAQRQGQRVFVEKIFEEGKNRVGLGDYQVRSWNGFHKHMAISFIALYYIFHQKITYGEELPLTAPIIRKLVAATISSKWDRIDSAIEVALKILKEYFTNDLNRSHQSLVT